MVCDDVYNRLVYTGGYARFAALHGELRDRIVVVDSFSKPWAMTGWRLGWVAACADVASEDRQGPPVHGLLRPRVRDACG